MSKRQYLKNLNREIQKLNGIIDLKILHGKDYHREALRHKRLLRQVRRQELDSSFRVLLRMFSWS